jgi:hypothetical protein
LPSGERFQLAVDKIETVERSVRWKGKDPEWVPRNCTSTAVR